MLILFTGIFLGWWFTIVSIVAARHHFVSTATEMFCWFAASYGLAWLIIISLVVWDNPLAIPIAGWATLIATGVAVLTASYINIRLHNDEVTR